jgi:hypothetical protein
MGIRHPSHHQKQISIKLLVERREKLRRVGMHRVGWLRAFRGRLWFYERLIALWTDGQLRRKIQKRGALLRKREDALLWAFCFLTCLF